MSIKILRKGDPFPLPGEADKSGLLAIGGTLDISTLRSAYSKGIFPWYSKGEPIMWWSPDPRMVLFPDMLHVSRSMEKLLKTNAFKVTCNRNFEKVINYCRSIDNRGSETWITDEMVDAYINFNKEGYAHSVEVWAEGILVGGFYGVAIGQVFFGESMFFIKKNASKFGFIKFTRYLGEKNFSLIDCQIYTEHLSSLGAIEISGKDFQRILKNRIPDSNDEKTVFKGEI